MAAESVLTMPPPSPPSPKATRTAGRLFPLQPGPQETFQGDGTHTPLGLLWPLIRGTRQGGSDGVDGDSRAYLVSYPSSLLGLSLIWHLSSEAINNREAESQGEVRSGWRKQWEGRGAGLGDPQGLSQPRTGVGPCHFSTWEVGPRLQEEIWES